MISRQWSMRRLISGKTVVVMVVVLAAVLAAVMTVVAGRWRY